MSTQKTPLLTPTQLQTARAIVALTEQNCVPPTMRELSVHLGISRIAAFDRVETLVRKGVVEKTYRGRERNIRVVVELPTPSLSPPRDRRDSFQWKELPDWAREWIKELETKCGLKAAEVAA